jgi:serine/threonine protein phosphatase PrpC
MQTMGTTMTMVYIVWPRAFVVHVGDSRCYMLRNDELDQVTVDHTVSEIMVEKGQMSREEAEHSPMGHVLWNVLGGRSNDLSVEVYKLTLECDDVLLLCTDGLYNMVPHETLQELLNSNSSAESACRKLVNQANENGGKDNVTVVVAHFLAPQVDESRAVVEAEVPLEELTAATSEKSKTITISDAAGANEASMRMRKISPMIRRKSLRGHSRAHVEVQR